MSSQIAEREDATLCADIRNKVGKSYTLHVQSMTKLGLTGTFFLTVKYFTVWQNYFQRVATFQMNSNELFAKWHVSKCNSQRSAHLSLKYLKLNKLA